MKISKSCWGSNQMTRHKQMLKEFFASFLSHKQKRSIGQEFFSCFDDVTMKFQMVLNGCRKILKDNKMFLKDHEHNQFW